MRCTLRALTYVCVYTLQQKKAVWVYSPTLAYHELEPSHASDLAVSLIKSIILSKRGWATVYNFMTNFTDTCNAFYSSQKVAV